MIYGYALVNNDSFVELEESNIENIFENDILLEGATFDKIKEFIRDKFEKFVQLLKDIKEAIVTFVREKIYKPIINIKNNLLNKITLKKEIEVTDSMIEQIQKNNESLIKLSDEIRELASNIDSESEKLDELRNRLIDSFGADAVSESNSIAKCTMLFPSNEGAIDRVIHYYESLSHAYSIFDNIIKYGRDQIKLTSDTPEEEEKGYKNLAKEAKKCIDIIEDIQKGIKQDGSSLVYSVEKKRATVTDILRLSDYERIFNFVEANSKKMIKLQGELDKSIQLFSMALKDANNMMNTFNQANFKRGVKLYKIIITILNRYTNVANKLKKLVGCNLRYLAVSGKIAMKNIKILSRE